MPDSAHRKTCVALWSGALLAVASLSAVPAGTWLHPPAKSRLLVEPRSYRLAATELRAEVEIVVLFYSASWCAPCKQAARALRDAYPDIVANEARIELLTYSLDFTPDARADYLRETRFPWPAVAPERIGQNGWPKSIVGGTPQFQAFIVKQQYWQALSPPSDAPTVFKQALTELKHISNH